MKVTDSREALVICSMNNNGWKVKLVVSLNEAVVNNMHVVYDRPPKVVNNNVGTAFDPNTYWKLVNPT